MEPTAPGKGRKYLIAMVGLPARGKTYTARKLSVYLSWLGHSTRVFNVGARRRSRVGARQTHEFFDPHNVQGERLRRELAMQTLESALAWLREGGRIAIYDATNSTRERRDEIRRRAADERVDVVFIEIVNDDPAVIEANVRETKLSSPDYAGVDPDEAVRDFRARIAHYERSYETLADDEGAFLRLVDRGRQAVMNRIDGYMPARIVFFLINLQVSERPVWLTRHGESAFNVLGRIGGDSPLSSAGLEYAERLAQRVSERFGGSPLQVWTSTLQRTRQTAVPLGREVVEWRSLDEIDAGVCDGLTYREIEQRMPREYEARAKDKLGYRYPRGESYEDVIQRTDRVIIEIERQRSPVLVIAHQAVVRVLYSYFVGLPPDRTPYVPVPLHTVIELTPRAYGCDERRSELGPLATQFGSSG